MFVDSLYDSFLYVEVIPLYKLMRCCEASGLMEGAGRADTLGIAGMAAGATVATWAESCNKSRRNPKNIHLQWDNQVVL